MYKVGIIGDRDSILGFMALGFAVHEIKNSEDAVQTLHKLVKTNEYAVIFIVEDIALQMQEDISKYKDMPLPAITVIPGSKGTTGYGMANIKSAVERAVGTDIIFKEDQ